MLREFKTVLCPTDFSAESYRALEYGARFATAAGGSLLIAHILHNPTTKEFHPEGYVLSFEQAKTRAQAQLEEIRAQRVGGTVKCDLFVDIGDPYEKLLSLATQRQVDLVVISTHGRSALEHLVMGSVAEKIIRHAPCPVLVVRRGTE